MQTAVTGTSGTHPPIADTEIPLVRGPGLPSDWVEAELFNGIGIGPTRPRLHEPATTSAELRRDLGSVLEQIAHLTDCSAMACIRSPTLRSKISLGRAIGVYGLLSVHLGDTLGEELGRPASEVAVAEPPEFVRHLKVSDLSGYIFQANIGLVRELTRIADHPQAVTTGLSAQLCRLLTVVSETLTPAGSGSPDLNSTPAPSTTNDQLDRWKIPAVPARPQSWVFRDPIFETALSKLAICAAEIHFANAMTAITTSRELPAIEWVARALLEYPEMPWQLRQDLAGLIWDEARHAESFWRLAVDGGSTLVPIPYEFTVWNNWRNGAPLHEQIKLQQGIAEQRGLMAGEEFSRTFRALGNERMARVFDGHNHDERRHTMVDTVWAAFLRGVA